MIVIINGEKSEVRDGILLVELLNDLDVRVEQVAVERNLEVVPRAEFAGCRLADGDALEIVTLVGGG